jgi:hypothetical protein
MTTLTLNDLTVALRALRMLAVDFPHLPVVDVHVSRIRPDRLELTLHRDLSAFETWRAALGIPADTLTYLELEQGSTGPTLCLQGTAEYAGATVELTGFAPLAHTPREADPEPVGGAA